MTKMQITKVDEDFYRVEIFTPKRGLEYLFNAFDAGSKCGFLCTQDYCEKLAERMRRYIIDGY